MFDAHMRVIRLQEESPVKPPENLVETLGNSMSILKMGSDRLILSIGIINRRFDDSRDDIWAQYLHQ